MRGRDLPALRAGHDFLLELAQAEAGPPEVEQLGVVLGQLLDRFVLSLLVCQPLRDPGLRGGLLGGAMVVPLRSGSDLLTRATWFRSIENASRTGPR